MKVKKSQKGISLIVLVITIIVIVILAVAVILTIANNNPIENAQKATFQNDLKTIQEEVNTYLLSQYASANGNIEKVSFTLDEMEDNFKSSSKYIGEVFVQDSKLVYFGNDFNKRQWAKEIGIKVMLDATKVEMVHASGIITSFNNVPEDATLYCYRSSSQVENIDSITTWNEISDPMYVI